ncbi:hypothetical protein [Lentilactobacillus laojiaonis]|uniref:hypothetical protein n=1 Tax=Lentilactobacillus laojiaonis TaxID=2883998 RepID=UPI001D0B02F9|nr:hypothetical protein [Lentilactobacillus laojiaonis]UDM32056.1 hypothetical protein LHL71_05880 [Lentilactobacillus laojiaonis]
MKNPFNDDDNNRNMLPIPPNYATVVNKSNGQIRIAKVGFSWTSFLFSILIPIFRRDWYNALCMIGVQWGIGFLIATVTNVNIDFAYSEATYALSVIWGAFYNLMYFRHLFNKGYVPADQHSRDILVQSGYLKTKHKK